MNYPAHIYLNENTKSIQTEKEHCEAVAKLAGESLKKVNLYHASYAAGLLHDIGKAQKEFAEYIEKASQNEDVRKGSVIHTFQGCRFILELNHKKDTAVSEDAICDEFIAYAIGAHHGLFDCKGIRKEHGFQHRMTEKGTGYNEVHQYLLNEILSESNINHLLQSARKELKAVLAIIASMQQEGFFNYCDKAKLDEQDGGLRIAQDTLFYMSLTARLLLSSVIEGDRRDTAAFMNGTQYPVFDGYTGDKMLFWEEQLKAMEEKLLSFPADTPIQQARREISDICRDVAAGKPGVYRLNVPTGAGKTLSSLRFALTHAAKNGMNRIVFTAPLLTIIDQNAAVIRSYLKDDSIVLEHHTNLSDELADCHEKEDLKRQELLAESWNVPVIITSMVQLLQTFFSGKTSSIRRFQALCNSVIVIDEAQAVPGKMLSLFNLMINYLSEICGTTILLCSATQPYFEGADHPLLKVPTEVVPYSESLWEPFKRTEIRKVRDRKLEEMPEFVLQEAAKTHSLLVVCNKKSEAEYLFQKIENTGEKCFHLSASMCMAHRKCVLREIMEAIKKSRKEGQRVICVTTQVIEAGVDISFGRVIRFAAGMDSIVQAAGRCNRNGEEPGVSPVYIIDCEGEKLGKLKEIADGKNAMRDLLISYEHSPAAFDNDLSSEKSIRYYYKSLYKAMPCEYQDYSIKGKGRSILSMMSLNSPYQDEEGTNPYKFVLNQAFAEAGKEFRVFDEETTDVVVPFGDGKEMISELGRKFDETKYVSGMFMADWLKRIKPYTVSLYNYQKEMLERNAGLYKIGDVLILQENCYSDKTGIINDNTGNGALLEV